MSPDVPRVRRKKRKISRTAERRRRILRGILLAACILFGFAAGLVVLSTARKTYERWREGRLLDKANALLQSDKLDAASAAALEALRISPGSVPALRVLAEAAEKENRAEALSWRMQIAKAEPQDADSQLNLASAALRFYNLDVARSALDSLSAADRNRATYHVVAGWLARAEGNQGEVERHFAAALKQEPANELYQFNLAVLQINSTTPEVNTEARAALERLSKNTKYRAASLRALLGDALHRKELPAADALAQELQMSQQVTFADYLLCLYLYRQMDPKKFGALIEKVKPVAERNPGDLGALLDWMNVNGLAIEVLKWTEKLSPDLTTHPPPAVSIAAACVETKNWSRLRRWTRTGTWNDADYLRLAYQAFAARQSKQAGADAEFDSLWHSAERATAEQPARQMNLARLASKWNLPVEAEQLWIRVSKNPSSRREALDQLAKIYRASNDLVNLHHTVQRLHEASPEEASVTATAARFGLLLDQNTAEAHRLAKEAFEKAPGDPMCVVTYALSLYGLGRTAEGVELLRKLSPEQLREPHAAVYYAVLLLDENQADAAREYIAIAQNGPVFPEEKKLLEEALAKATAQTAAPTPTAP